MADQDPPQRPPIPLKMRTEEFSVPNPAFLPGPILTLSPEEIARFFVRVRREQDDTERWDVRLDAALREILERANDFVPSESGGILLDDPRAKLAGSPAPRLTFIAAFGPGGENLLGKRVPSDRGFAGQIYRSGRPFPTDALAPEDPMVQAAVGTELRTLIGVPVIVGESICGVLYLANRRSGGSYVPRDKELLRIFAAYMSSSIQNALDAIRARALARVDDLTGLFNSRYFHTRLEDEIVRADRDNSELSMLFIDLDRFKTVNDRFGHLAGSWTLQKVARLLAENAPPAAVLARYGGDEFVVILPGSNLQRAKQTAETLRAIIADTTFFDAASGTSDTTPLPRISASLGVASYREHLAPGGSHQRRENIFLRLADSAMYRAKANGRNRVESAEAEE
ncbi:MAG TPA: sensor domain-containing diguanylate cyclase [Polyangia bacterium]|nr:sensor domain-containing diguanylate cyclase [Polyangia bacterium]